MPNPTRTRWTRTPHAHGPKPSDRCWVDGGTLSPTKCPKCNEEVEDRIEALLGRLDKQAGGNW